MLLNSNLSQKKYEISDAITFEFMDDTDRKAHSAFKETKDRIQWGKKLPLETHLVSRLFNPDVANFFIETKDLRISFQYDNSLEPMSLSVTQAKMQQTEIKTMKPSKKPEEKPQIVKQYMREPHYNTFVITGENIKSVSNKPTTNQKFEAVLPRESDPSPYPNKAFNLDTDRMIVSLHPSVKKNSESLETLENFIREKYVKEMRALELRQEDRKTLSANYTFEANFAIGTGKSVRSVRKAGM